MSQQPPGTDPTRDPEGEPTPEAGTPPPQQESDAETARVPWEEAAPPPAAAEQGWASPAAPPSPPGVPPPASADTAGTPQEGGTGPAVLWATPTAQARLEVPGAPGLSFADTASRLIAFIIDSILVGVVGSIIAAVLGFGTTRTFQSGTATGVSTSVQGAAFAVPFLILGFVYFVFFWTGGRRATPGQQIFKLQVGNAFDGQPLTVTQAIKRWLGYGTFLTIFALVPTIYALASLAQFIWFIVLLVTTAQSPTKQGLHDRFANTAVVRPSGESGGLAKTCLIIGIVLFLILLFSIVGLIFLGSQMSDILSRVGTSV